jgi:NADH-quinone oxidoreductase subunit J
MSPAQVVFLIVAAMTLFSAVMVVSLKNMMHSALMLILALLGVAVIFAMLDAGFFAIIQVVVYIGAIAILIIFAVMLTRNVMLPDPGQLNRGFILAGLGSALMLAGVAFALSAWPGFMALPGTLDPAADPVVTLGLALTDPQGFALPFEAISILLLSAVVGGIYIARDRRKDEDK